MVPTIELGSEGMSAADVLAVARGGAQLTLSDEARHAIAASAEVVERILADGVIAYGVTTGFGSLADTVIPARRSAELQVALLRSHAAGMGPLVEAEVVRAMVALRARSLAMGYSGARAELVEALLALLHHGLTPAVPEHGSLGASGDLAPLAHCALVVIGEGAVLADGAAGERAWLSPGPWPGTVTAAAALEAAGLTPVRLRAKEGLALINGTDGILGLLVLALDDLAHLLRLADVAAAMTVEGLLGTDRVFADDLQRLRPQVGQADSAANLRRLLDGSAIVASHRVGDTRVQDAYSLRCTPAVHGAVRDAATHAAVIAGRELRAAIDNPLILPDGRVESCGNFHGAPLAQVCDYLKVAVADLASICERRTDRMLDKGRSHGLPPFLAADPGVDSGLMIAHYTQVAMVTETRRLATPASIDTIPTSAMQEDHVSLGWAAARALRRSVADLRRVLVVELICAARALEQRAPLRPAAGTGAALHALRSVVGGVGPDRWLAPELVAVDALVADRRVVAAVEDVVGPLS